MKPWEREIIEYRPDIGLKRDILSVVTPREYLAKFKPSAIVNRLTDMLGIDVVESIMASLSRGVAMLNQIEKSLAGDDTFAAYKAADEIEAREIYLNHLADINGNADFDIYPILADSIEEMEEFLDYLNEELFGGKLDYSDLSPTREREEQEVVGLLDIESEDLRIQVKDDLSPEQMHLVNRMIDDPNHPLNSVEEYLEYINKEIREEGSQRIEYDKLLDRIHFIAATGDKAKMFRGLMDQSESYLTVKLSDYVDEDLPGSLEFLVDAAGSLEDLKAGMQASFDFHAKESQEDYINSLRISGRDVRTFLDKQMAEVKAKKNQLTTKLMKFYQPDHYQTTGAQMLMTNVAEAFQSTEALWKYVVVEHIGTTEMNANQHEKVFGVLHGKRKQQAIYHYVDLVDREFDRDNREHELNRFISIHGLANKR